MFLLPCHLLSRLGVCLIRLAACWRTDGSSNHLHIIILQGPALSHEEVPGITVQMVVCNEPSGVSGFNVSPQRDSYYCVCITCLFGGLSALGVGVRWEGAEDAVCGIFTISCVSVCDWVRITAFVRYQTDSFPLCHCSIHLCCCLLSFPTVIPIFFFFSETVTVVDLVLMPGRLILCEGVKLWFCWILSACF